MARSKTTDLERAREAAAIWEANQKGHQAIGYLPRVMAQVSLPYNRPKPGTLVWSRRNGNTELLLTPRVVTDGPNGKAGTPMFPFGSYPRLLIAWLATQAVRTGGPVIPLGDTAKGFLSELGIGNTGGASGPAGRFREQALNLLESSFTINVTRDGHDEGHRFLVASHWDLYWGKPGPDGQVAMMPSTIVLSDEFHRYVASAKVPVDWTILRWLGSAMAMDLYVWLTYRFSYLQAPSLVPWLALRAQLGSDYADDAKGMANFRKAVTAAWASVRAVYPEAGVTITKDGLLLTPSRTSVPFRGLRALASEA
ncbi:replication protein RepA [Amycolatopsis magusensis]|uniref:replication protein RepA n=1 Tax=Amycolatopsis magusensis TaxID=882444 RepID=UPI00379CACA3